jgi:hypothetical protein
MTPVSVSRGVGPDPEDRLNPIEPERSLADGAALKRPSDDTTAP